MVTSRSNRMLSIKPIPKNPKARKRQLKLKPINFVSRTRKPFPPLR